MDCEIQNITLIILSGLASLCMALDLPVVWRKNYLLGSLLLLFSSNSFSHIVGITDTSIEIAKPGVRIVYTIPQHTLATLFGNGEAATTVVLPIADYIDQIKSGWGVSADHQGCHVVDVATKELAEIKSYQYILDYQCKANMDDVVVRYQLFLVNTELSNKNFTRIAYGDIKSGLTMDENKNILNIPVSLMLKTKGSVLADTFSFGDLNKNLAENPVLDNKVDNKVVVPVRRAASVAEKNSTVKSELISQLSPALVDKGDVKKIVIVNEEISKVDTDYILLGTEHILRGYDHILFVVALLLIPVGFWRLLTWVTAFTLAHSITLGLSVFDIVSVKPSIIEPLIAFTIMFVAVENLWFLKNSANGHFDQVLLKQKTQYRWILTFVFGLLHGIGFSYALKEIGLGENIARTLFYFNVGVELGQLFIIALILPMLLLLVRLKKVLIISRAASIGVGAAGFFWFLQRVA